MQRRSCALPRGWLDVTQPWLGTANTMGHNAMARGERASLLGRAAAVGVAVRRSD